MFQRGFKAWCENVAIEVRRQLGLEAHESLDTYKLAEHLNAEVVHPEAVDGVDSQTLRVLLQIDPDSWSAITVTVRPKPVIVLNSAHSPARRASSLAHELAHILIGHAASQTGISPQGMLLTTYDRQQEDEANWLAGCLLLPRVACMHVRTKYSDLLTAARHYGVSRDMLQYRMNISGVQRQMSAWAKRANRSGSGTRS